LSWCLSSPCALSLLHYSMKPFTGFQCQNYVNFSSGGVIVSLFRKGRGKTGDKYNDLQSLIVIKTGW
jgi:hypothetical protein